MKHFVSLENWSREALTELLDLATSIKAHPAQYRNALDGKVLLMIFEKPSLRTRVSFETGMTHMGGHAIHYDTSTSPLGAGKESLYDTIKVVSRYVDIILARLFAHKDMEDMEKYATVPVINGLTNFSHPCQILADLLTLREKKGTLKGLKLCYLGDGNNNVTHSLMLGCAIMGVDIRVGSPADHEFAPQAHVLETAQALANGQGSKVTLFDNPLQAAEGADVVYTDTWMSYHIPQEEQAQRLAHLQPFQVNSKVMDAAASDAIFMNCLPAARGLEQTAEVIDGPASVVFDQAENRMHAQNAIMVKLLESR